MGRRFSIACLLALTALSFLVLCGRAGANSGPITARALLQSPKQEESTPDSEPPEDDSPSKAETVGTGMHHSSDKAAIGGGVIVCGLVAAMFATVFLYIRVTGRRPALEIMA